MKVLRADLLDRLAFDVVQLPPLRERESDIMLMAEHFAIQMCREIKLPLFPGFTERARETLLNYRWPGNIRELKTWWNVQYIATAPAIIRLMTLLLIPLNGVRLKTLSPFQKPPRFQHCRWIYVSFRCSRKRVAATQFATRKYNQKRAAGAGVNLSSVPRVVEKAPDLAKLGNTTCRMRRECFVRHT